MPHDRHSLCEALAEPSFALIVVQLDENAEIRHTNRSSERVGTGKEGAKCVRRELAQGGTSIVSWLLRVQTLLRLEAVQSLPQCLAYGSPRTYLGLL